MVEYKKSLLSTSASVWDYDCHFEVYNIYRDIFEHQPLYRSDRYHVFFCGNIQNNFTMTMDSKKSIRVALLYAFLTLMCHKIRFYKKQ